MFNSKRIKALEEDLALVRESYAKLFIEVRNLNAACTMRVGEPMPLPYGYFGPYHPVDKRPTATAIELIAELLQHQKLSVNPVRESAASFVVEVAT